MYMNTRTIYTRKYKARSINNRRNSCYIHILYIRRNMVVWYAIAKKYCIKDEYHLTGCIVNTERE